ncbi:hypothetical protein LUZ60_015740 [Juncus effusus]|nr:hypothetical protein LUZ60_015740 [Juncus effusus]
MKEIHVQLRMFLFGGFVAVLLMLSINYTNSRLGTWPPFEILPMRSDQCNNMSVGEVTVAKKHDEDPLADILEKAAMEDKTVIMTQVNAAWSAPNSLLDFFLEGFHVGEGIEHLLSHLVIVAVDPASFERCKTLHPYCYFMKTDGNYTTEKVYMSKDYLDLLWERNAFQLRILKLGYNFLFSDVDILWLRNPFRHIALTSHFAFASDFFYGDEDSIERSTPNGGFMYVKSSNKTIEFFKNWHTERPNWPDQHEQYVLNRIKVEYVKRFKVRMQFITTMYTGGFCEMSKDITKVCTVHANCCVGINTKLNDLKIILEDWKKYISLPSWADEKKKFQFRNQGICLHPEKGKE